VSFEQKKDVGGVSKVHRVGRFYIILSNPSFSETYKSCSLLTKEVKPHCRVNTSIMELLLL
jgi:hypothetical protein